MASSLVTVEEVDGRKELARFVELPQALHGSHPSFAPPVMAWERYRVDHRRNPYFDRAEVSLLLARRLGRVVGRIAVHVADAEPADGRFGFWALEDDDGTARALIDAAQDWLRARGCSSMRGPSSFDDDDEPGLLVAGFDVPGCTGRPWNPEHAGRLLEAAGATCTEDTATWRLPTDLLGDVLVPGGPNPGQAAGYVDQRLVADEIAAVPDVAPALRSAGFRQAWALARRARHAAWDDAVVVRCSGDPVVMVPAMCAAAGRAGYRSVVAPWSPDPELEPETRHRRYRISW